MLILRNINYKNLKSYQTGSVSVGASSTVQKATVSFSKPFSVAPIVAITNFTHPKDQGCSIYIKNITKTGFTIYGEREGGSVMNGTVTWIAIEP